MIHLNKMVLNYKKRENVYKNSTGSLKFDPVTCEAFSYKWWRFVAKIEGKVIFNNYNYSNTTSKHQYQVKRLLEQLGIKIDIQAPFPNGIALSSLQELIEIAEENLCDQFLREESKRIERNEKAKIRRELKKQQEVKRLIERLGHVANCDQIYKQLDKLNEVK